MVKLIDIVIETRNEDLAAENAANAAALKAKQDAERDARVIRDYAKHLVRTTDVTVELIENLDLVLQKASEAVKRSSALLMENSDLTLDAVKSCCDSHDAALEDFTDLAQSFLGEYLGIDFDKIVDDGECECDECGAEADRAAESPAQMSEKAASPYTVIAGSPDSAAVGVVIANIMAGNQNSSDEAPCDCALCQHIEASNKVA